MTIFGQNGPVGTATIEVRSVIPQVYAAFELRAEDNIVIPYCAETELGTPILCFSRIRLQVETAGQWRAAKLRKTFGVLANPIDARMKARIMGPGTKAVFVFVFSRRFFEVDPGQKMRVIVEAWSDSESMRTRRPPIQLTSPAFECPESGTGS